MATAHTDTPETPLWKMPPDRIDVVMTWVDGEDAEYQKLQAQYQASPKALNPERFRDAHDLLRYSLRSVVTHLGDLLGTVYLVTQKPQRPDWLRSEVSGLEIVHHESIFPDTSCLPTFSSNAIESCLQHIPSLRDWYLYFCDDYFLGQKTGLENLISPEGKPYLRGTLLGEAWELNAWDFRHHPFAKFHHFPHLFYRPWVFEMETAWKEMLQRTRQRKFRHRPDVAPERLYRYFLLKEKRRENSVLPLWKFLREYRFHKLTNHRARQKAALDKLAANTPRFLCLNDDQGPSPDPQIGDWVQALLEKLFPQPCPFEKT